MLTTEPSVTSIAGSNEEYIDCISERRAQDHFRIRAAALSLSRVRQAEFLEDQQTRRAANAARNEGAAAVFRDALASLIGVLIVEEGRSRALQRCTLHRGITVAAATAAVNASKAH